MLDVNERAKGHEFYGLGASASAQMKPCYGLR